ncbi:MAG: type II toxin-antitoxin system VapC family toxin [Proteobacteria bacterium]|nr:type II toxin-antitoxin system VapC family toxin [Pseudomonadota bacterium]
MSRELFVAEPVETYNTLPPIVVDCSVLAAILFNEPSQAEALKLLSGKSLYAPNLIDHEIISVAVKKSEAKARDLVRRGLDGFRKLRLARHSIDHQAQFELALSQKVSACDTACLQLAVSLNAPLATYDRVLACAASKVLSSR